MAVATPTVYRNLGKTGKSGTAGALTKYAGSAVRKKQAAKKKTKAQATRQQAKIATAAAKAPAKGKHAKP